MTDTATVRKAGGGPDFVDELVQESDAASPGFEARVEQAARALAAARATPADAVEAAFRDAWDASEAADLAAEAPGATEEDRQRAMEAEAALETAHARRGEALAEEAE